MDDFIIPVHVECILRQGKVIDEEALREQILRVLSKSVSCFEDGPVDISESKELQEYIQEICICDMGQGKQASFWQVVPILHLFRFSDCNEQKAYLDETESIAVCKQWRLPNPELSSRLWESIIVEEAIKSQLLGYCASSRLFSDAGVDPSIICWNRMVLLYGPPGTGKTTLCKALAQKVFVRNEVNRYQSGLLIEINAHALFSKWFSQSGKQVMQLFEHVEELAGDAGRFVAVLVDEVESITASRRHTLSGSEPGDATRVVNAVLTSLDALRNKPNVLVLCTSNLIEGIDEAFLDRLDLRVEIRLPVLSARYSILKSCLLELIDRGILLQHHCASSPKASEPSPDEGQGQTAVVVIDSDGDGQERSNGHMIQSTKNGLSRESNHPQDHADLETSCDDQVRKLIGISEKAQGMSGRALRKLPLKAHAFYLQRYPCRCVLDAMELLVTDEKRLSVSSDTEAASDQILS